MVNRKDARDYIAKPLTDKERGEHPSLSRDLVTRSMRALSTPDIWVVQLPGMGEGQDIHLFKRRSDVETSINTTWSKCMSDIEIIGDSHTIVIYDKRGRLILYARWTGRGEPLKFEEGPTHF